MTALPSKSSLIAFVPFSSRALRSASFCRASAASCICIWTCALLLALPPLLMAETLSHDVSEFVEAELREEVLQRARFLEPGGHGSVNDADAFALHEIDHQNDDHPPERRAAEILANPKLFHDGDGLHGEASDDRPRGDADEGTVAVDGEQVR